MIVGPVSFHQEKSFFQKIQSLEFLSLIAMTAGAIKTGHPIMCNGANLAYEKQAFFDVGGFGIDRFSSGDDVFLLHRKHLNDLILIAKEKNYYIIRPLSQLGLVISA